MFELIYVFLDDGVDFELFECLEDGMLLMLIIFLILVYYFLSLGYKGDGFQEDIGKWLVGSGWLVGSLV